MVNRNYQKQVLQFILFASVLRFITGYLLELGVDEVYYRNYALRPDWNHFDHPPLVGLAIQLTTLNLLLDNELFIRLPAIIGAAVNSWLIFKLTTRLSNERSGYIAVLLYNASLYFSIIAGLFILPDSVQVIFWLLCIQLAIDIFQRADGKQFRWILFGVTAGLCTMSKVHGVFAWVAVGVYILFYDRQQLRNGYLYAGIFTTLLCIAPIVYWNIQYDFITYRFHSERVTPGFQWNVEALLREIAGSFAYQNPINFVLYVSMGVAMLRKKFEMPQKGITPLLLFFSLPLIIIFLIIATQRETLPHWNGPAYLPLLILTAIWLGEKYPLKLPRSVKASLALTGSILLLGIAWIRFAPFTIGEKKQESFGQYDFTLDMYGWRQLGTQFKTIYERDRKKGIVKQDVKLITHKYFPAAHLDYYVARPLHLPLIAIGSLTDIHIYAWLNNDRKALQPGENAYCIVPSNYPSHPQTLFRDYFEDIRCTDTITIYRGGKPVRYGFVYLLKNCTKVPAPLFKQ